MNPETKAHTELTFTASPVLHPDYKYWAQHWQAIRDAEIGEVEIKRKGQRYLPKLQSQDAQQYARFLDRATFYNMTSRTLQALYGTVFRRNPKVTGFDKNLEQRSKRFSKTGLSLHLTAKTIVKEVLALGRHGCLVDASPDGRGGAYVAMYTAENILDWETEEIDGRIQYTRVVLREIVAHRDNPVAPYRYKARYRVLVLQPSEEGWIYEQHIFEHDDARGGVPNLEGIPDDIKVPMVRGQPMPYIPFIAFGPFDNTANAQKPPVLDIVTLNLSHYRSYADLEQGRFFTATPVYYVNGRQEGESSGEYYIGPDVVWELGAEGKAGVIEYQGQGLRFLESALSIKESQIAAIGGRLMPGSANSPSESGESLQLKEQNEYTLLLNLVDCLDEGMTELLGWWADWNNASTDVVSRVQFEANRDFLTTTVGAREFRAIHQMYSEGAIPLEVFYHYLHSAEVIPEWLGRDEFQKLVESEKSFPNQMNVIARMRGFPDAKSWQEWKLATREVAPREGEPDQPMRATRTQ